MEKKFEKESRFLDCICVELRTVKEESTTCERFALQPVRERRRMVTDADDAPEPQDVKLPSEPSAEVGVCYSSTPQAAQSAVLGVTRC